LVFFRNRGLIGHVRCVRCRSAADMLGNNENEAGYYKIAAYGKGVTLSDAAWDEFNRACFTCANSLDAKNRAKVGVPTFLFRYFGHWDNLRLYPTSGAYHGADLEMVFGASADVSGTT